VPEQEPDKTTVCGYNPLSMRRSSPMTRHVYAGHRISRVELGCISHLSRPVDLQGPHHRNQHRFLSNPPVPAGAPLPPSEGETVVEHLASPREDPLAELTNDPEVAEYKLKQLASLAASAAVSSIRASEESLSWKPHRV